MTTPEERYNALIASLEELGVPTFEQNYIGFGSYKFVQGVNPPGLMDLDNGKLSAEATARVGKETAIGILNYISSPDVTDEQAQQIWSTLANSITSDPNFSAKPNAQKMFADLDALVNSEADRATKVEALNAAINAYYSDPSIGSETPMDISAETLASIESIPAIQSSTEPQQGEEASPAASPLAMPDVIGADGATIGLFDALIENLSTINPAAMNPSAERDFVATELMKSAEFSSEEQEALANVLYAYLKRENAVGNARLDKEIILAISNGTASPEEYAKMFATDRSGDATRRAALTYYLNNAGGVDNVKAFMESWYAQDAGWDRENDLAAAIANIEDPSVKAIATYAEFYFDANDDAKTIDFTDSKVFADAFANDPEALYAFLTSPEIGNEAAIKLLKGAEGKVADYLEDAPDESRNKLFALALQTDEDSKAHKAAVEYFKDHFFEGDKLNIDKTLELLKDPALAGENNPALGAFKSLVTDDMEQDLIDYIKDEKNTPADKLALAAAFSEESPQLNLKLIYDAYNNDPEKLGGFLKAAYAEDPNLKNPNLLLFLKDITNFAGDTEILSTAFGTTLSDDGKTEVPLVPYSVAKELASDTMLVNSIMVDNGTRTPDGKVVPVTFEQAQKDEKLQQATDAVMASISNTEGRHEEPKEQNCMTWLTDLFSMVTNMFTGQAQEADKETDLDLQRNLDILNIEGDTLEEKVKNYIKKYGLEDEVLAGEDAFAVVMDSTKAQIKEMKKSAVFEEAFKDNAQIATADDFSIARDGATDTVYFSAYDANGNNILFRDVKNAEGEVTKQKSPNATIIQDKIKGIITANLDLRTIADGLGEDGKVTQEQVNAFAESIGTGVVHLGGTTYTIRGGKIESIKIGSEVTPIDDRNPDFVIDTLSKDLKNKSNYTYLDGTPPAFLLKMDVSVSESIKTHEDGIYQDTPYSFRFNVPLDVMTSANLKYIELQGLELQTLTGIFAASANRDYKVDEIEQPTVPGGSQTDKGEGRGGP